MKKSIGISPNIETLFGTRDENVRVLEDGLKITIDLRSNAIELEGAAARRGSRRAGFCRLRKPAALRIHVQQRRS